MIRPILISLKAAITGRVVFCFVFWFFFYFLISLFFDFFFPGDEACMAALWKGIGAAMEGREVACHECS